MPIPLNRLNERQQQAVLHGEGPLLVLAGAGSGKTSTMAYRIAHLVADRHVSPSAVLGLSFTRKAAAELKDRVRKLIIDTAGSALTRGLTITTFHSLCVRILRLHADRLGFQKDFSIMDSHDQTDLLRRHLRQIKLDDRKFDPSLLLFEIGQAKNRFLSPDQADAYFTESGKLPPDYAMVAGSLFTKYQDSLHSLNSMDFDDLIFNAVKLLESHADLRDGYSLKFKHVLVDEYQDTNPAQSRLLALLTTKHKNICVVGDDDQSIYAWRGADPTHILNFARHYPGARTITLDQNYRSTNTILEAANQVIAKNTQRHDKQLWSDRGQGEPILQYIVEEDRAEAEFVAEEILRRARKAKEGQVEQIRAWKDFAVLYRSNPQSRLFEEAFRMRQIPYKVVGSMSFLDRKEIKDTLSYWKVVSNSKDDASVRRVINWPARGIGKSTMDAVNQYALEQGLSFFEALREVPKLSPRAAAPTLAFRRLIEGLRTTLEATPATSEAIANWARRSLDTIGAKKGIEEEEDDMAAAARKLDNIEELANAIGQMDLEELAEQEKEAGGDPLTAPLILREFLARMTLNALDDAPDKKDKKENAQDQVTLLTLHGAKGLEYPIVFLVGMEDGYLPHQRSIDEAGDLSEERRLCYVGITRARDHLILTRAANRIRYGKAVPRSPSRFLLEVPSHLVITENQSKSPDLSSPEKKEEHETKVKDFLASIRAQIQGVSKERRL